MELIKAQIKDIDLIMTFINDAKEFLKSKGVDQWQGEYPNRQSIVDDISKGIGYLISDGKAAVGYCCVDFGGESAYDDLIGAWLSCGNYAVLHRLTVSREYRSKGFADKAFSLAEKLTAEEGVFSIKIDTHEDNKTMRHLLEKNGYTYCGKVTYPQGDRIAFEKLIIQPRNSNKVEALNEQNS